MDERALARIIMTVLQGMEQGIGIVRLGLHMHPAAEMIVVMEMRVIGGEGGQPLAFVEQLVEQIEAFAAVGFDRAAMVVDLDRMRNVDGESIGKGKLRPGRM